MQLIDSPKYRKDIDGLRAIAVIPVLIFHFGYLSNGYLGVDIFFVISGYLITGIIYREIQNNSFSILDFYIRRTRRIIPLVSFICIFSLILGIFTMLPDDLENLAQSIIATNFFGNNVLQILTTKNYWDIVNEFKPLMHTWSLGIEEQYYLIYPFIFLFIGKKKKHLVLPLLLILTVVSLFFYFSNAPDYQKFYLLQYRFFELSLGGIAAIILNGRILKHSIGFVSLLLLLALLIFDTPFISSSGEIVCCTILTTCILISDNRHQKILVNPIALFIGKISFSLYMWHQVVLAFSRYFIFKEITLENLIIITPIIFIFSYLTYRFIEQPFRNKKKMSLKVTLYVVIIAFIVTTGVSFYIFLKAGVIKDIPELGIQQDSAKQNMHALYNDRIYSYDKNFSENNKLNVLIIGNSFARDWANVLIESSFSKQISISYIYYPSEHSEQTKRISEADVIFLNQSTFDTQPYQNSIEDKLWFIGVKNFGINNGIFYNYLGGDYCNQRTIMEKGIIEKNEMLTKQWGDRYIDLISPIINEDKTVPVFTPDCKFISQDCRHYTKFGAGFMSKLLEEKIAMMLSSSTND